MKRHVKRVGPLIATIATVVLTTLGPAVRSASAHPLGNFTINRYTGIGVDSGRITLDAVTDMAEIPAFSARERMDTNGDKAVSDSEGARWATEECAAQSTTLRVTTSAGPLPIVETTVRALTFPPGQAGLSTLRLECSLRTAVLPDTSESSVTFDDSTYPDRVGWHEITVSAGPGTQIVGSDTPRTSVTNRLTDYPKNQLQAPVTQRRAKFTVRTTSAQPASALATDSSQGSSTRPSAQKPKAESTRRIPTGVFPRSLDRASQAFTDLVARRDLTIGFGLLAVLMSLVLGAFHALAPGHGKTVMAAYLVGERGSPRQAALIGLTVTATHTAGVVVLGILLTTTHAIAPERLYPWLGLMSGLLLAGIGTLLIRRASRMSKLTRAGADEPLTVPAAWTAEVGMNLATVASRHDHRAPHSHDANHSHDAHHPHDHQHHHTHQHGHKGHHGHQGHPTRTIEHSHGGFTHTHPVMDPALGWKSLIGVGFAGGMVPSPSALLVLLGAIALGRTWFGLLLVTSYGAGMALMLTAAGLLLVRARSWFDRRSRSASGSTGLLSPMLRLGRFLPWITSSTIVVLGLSLALREIAKL